MAPEDAQIAPPELFLPPKKGFARMEGNIHSRKRRKAMKIIVLDGYAHNPGDLSWAEIQQLGELTVYDRTPPGEILARIGDAPIVFTNKVILNEPIFAACPGLQYIGVLATGYNVVDVQAAGRRNICVTNIPSYSTLSVTQMVFALLLEVCLRVGHHSRRVHEGAWSESKDFCFWDYPLMELAGKTMGIIGFGQIGHHVAQAAQAFGMKALVYTPHPDASLAGEGLRFGSLEEVLSTAHVISLHCPLNQENAGMINRDTIARMRDGVILINTARGGLIREADLREALKSGKVYGAGLDVAAVEPIPQDSPLLGAPNCFITPHIAWAPREARERLMRIAADNLRQYLKGHPVNRVSPIF